MQRTVLAALKFDPWEIRVDLVADEGGSVWYFWLQLSVFSLTLLSKIVVLRNPRITW